MNGPQLSAAIDAPMKDWPLALRINAVACKLARDIYQGASDVYAPGSVPFEDLEPRLRDRYIALAVETLVHALAPPQVSDFFPWFVALTRHQARVIGSIAPEKSDATCLVSAADYAQHFCGKESR